MAVWVAVTSLVQLTLRLKGVASPVIDEGEAPGKTALDQDPMPRAGARLCCLTP